MGAANVAVVEQCIAAIGRRDAETVIALSAGDVEIVPLRAALEDTVYRGTDGIRRWLHDISESWHELWIDVEQSTEPEPDVVLSTGMFRARGNMSDAPTSLPVWLVCWLRDGLVTKAAVFTEQAEAERALERATG